MKIRPNPRALSAAMSVPWAILPQKLEEIIGFLQARMSGVTLSAEEVAALKAAAPAARTAGSVGVLPIFGTIFDRSNMMADFSGGTSLEKFTAAFRALIADEAISAVVLDVDSPGGATPGVQEAAQTIFEARDVKPVVAVANKAMFSAAYWLASQASEIVVSPSGEVGSIGVWTVHYDWSQAYADAGVKPTLISAGKYKTTGAEEVPLDEEGLALIQQRVDDVYSVFTANVARGRDVTPAAVRDGFGQGWIVGAKEAVKEGMADRVATLEDTVARLAGRRKSRNAGAMGALAALEV